MSGLEMIGTCPWVSFVVVSKQVVSPLVLLMAVLSGGLGDIKRQFAALIDT